MATTVAVIYFAAWHRQYVETREIVHHVNVIVQDDGSVESSVCDTLMHFKLISLSLVWYSLEYIL